ncbi:MAG TPA: glycosyltransferase [Verrucomicrobiae bacterium]
MKPIRVAHVTTSISRLGGGLYESVRHLSMETHKNGVQMEILGLQDAFTEADAPQWVPVTVRSFPIAGPKRFGYAPGLFRHLQRSANDIVHLHGVWQYPTAATLRWARATGRPYVVSAHGMLEPWALRRSRFKKTLVNWLFQNICLREAACLRATAEAEVESLRRLGLKNPVALIPNGVFIPEVIQKAEAGDRKPEVRRALFLSRIHPKKGLLELVRAWKKYAATLKPERLKSAVGGPISGLRSPVSDPWELLIVGPDEGGHLAEVMALVNELGLQDQIRYGGEIWEDDAKWKCYAGADLFVLPSFSENFGLVIAEALGCGVPVVTTHATPWRDLETHQCGWWIDTGVAALADCLKSALAVPPEDLRAMGLRGRQLIQSKYGWTLPGRQMTEVYEWLAGRIPPPACIF